jgi:hypothetical protein
MANVNKGQVTKRGLDKRQFLGYNIANWRKKGNYDTENKGF